MIYAVNILPSADLGLVLSQLSSLGVVSQPFPRTPRYVELEAPEGQEAAVEAIAGVCGCCDADEFVALTVIEPQTPGYWHIGDISGNPQTEYGRDTGQFYLADVPPNTSLVTDCELIFNPSGGFGDHGTGTADTARKVWPHARIYASECFLPSGSGTVSTVNAGLNAIADHREDSGWAGLAVCNCSFTSGGFSNPYSAIMQRLTDLGVIVVASTGNDGINISTTPRWPASGADYAVGAVDKNHLRPSWSNWPADIYAGGEGCDFLISDGTLLTNVGGTSISSPVFAMSLRRALDEGRDGAWLLSQSRLIATNVPSGTNAVLTYPTTETTSPPPPPPPPTQEMPPMPSAIRATGSHPQISANTWTPFELPNVESDDNGWYIGGGQFKPGVTGYYDVSGYAGFTAGTARDTRVVVVDAAGNMKKWLGNCSTYRYACVVLADMVYLDDPDDRIRVDVKSNSNATPSGRVVVRSVV